MLLHVTLLMNRKGAKKKERKKSKQIWDFKENIISIPYIWALKSLILCSIILFKLCIIRLEFGNQEYSFDILLWKISSTYRSRQNSIIKPPCTHHLPSTLSHGQYYFIYSLPHPASSHRILLKQIQEHSPKYISMSLIVTTIPLS